MTIRRALIAGPSLDGEPREQVDTDRIFGAIVGTSTAASRPASIMVWVKEAR